MELFYIILFSLMNSYIINLKICYHICDTALVFYTAIENMDSNFQISQAEDRVQYHTQPIS